MNEANAVRAVYGSGRAPGARPLLPGPDCHQRSEPARWERVSWERAESELCVSRETVKRRAREALARRVRNPAARQAILEGRGVAFVISGRWVKLRKPARNYAVQFERDWDRRP